MAKAPAQQPLVDIPGIESAKTIQFRVQGQGENLKFKLYVDRKEVQLDSDSEYMDRDWFGIVVRELDRRNWHYSVDTTDKRVTVFKWSPSA